MKNLFYFLFGFFTMLILLALAINHCGDEFIHEYWMNRLYTDLSKPYAHVNIVITIVWAILAVIYVYALGKSTSHNENEVLIINKEKDEDAYSPSQCDRCDADSNKNK